MSRFAQLVQDCDQAIREGRPQDAGKRLGDLRVARIPREWRLPLAKICRRSGHYVLGLKLLFRLVHAKTPKDRLVSSEELTEYAGILLRIGAVSEAIDRLDRIDANAVPDALLYRAFGRFLRWEFHPAIADLTRYLETPLSAYSTLVGRTNLAFAYVETRQHNLAMTILEENIHTMGRDGHHQLLSNCRALCAQVYVHERNFSLARTELNLARQIFSSTQSYDQFLVTKWSFILDGLEKHSLEEFTTLEKLAVENHDWESLREVDLYRLKVSNDKERFAHLYFGTPFAGFRDILYTELGSRPTETSYVLGPKSAPCMDLSSGEIDGRPALSLGRKCHQLIEVFLRDFYQPLRTAGIFSALFPEEHFDIGSSPDRIRQSIRRARRWLESEKIPVKIVEAKGFYSLRTEGLFSFRVPLDRPKVEPFSLYFATLKQTFKHTQFITKDVRSKLGLSEWEARQLINWGIKRGVVQSLGDTKRSAIYRVATDVVPNKKVA